ncbi:MULTISPECIES: LemA family protein [unclassified Polaromonas]|uniref:LemA family protein n=1 Tax=unclassified Polaromonas TaxID=2638319 RepID=UPI0018C9F15B|nr:MULTISPECIES: LemA family protein [unclassified Polaromonas]MBG6074020.1 LemA protein [Polaromonas sp. CG_9.7]MBG6116022.1 LemA protein [Polaromonas sp. CG_9.2]MDH6183565.1 LemA protein [Polaromonas sp. CG_23.6]
MSLQTIVSLTLLAMLVFWAVGAYNRLVRLKNVIANAFGQVDVQLKRRYDLIPNLVEAAQKYVAHEQAALEAVIAARNQARSASDAVRSRPGKADAVIALAAAEQTLDGSLGRLFALAEAYPDLKADQTVRELSEELTTTENKVGFARQAYNDAVLDYNNAQGQFPALLLARLFGFAPSAMLQSTEDVAERQAVRTKM